MRRTVIMTALLLAIGIAGCGTPQTAANTTQPPKQTAAASASTEIAATSPAESTVTAEAAVSSTMELKKVGRLQYYLYTPANPTEGMPLIIYLHGGTNKKEDVTALLTTDGFPEYLYEGYYGDLRAYVAVPKLENSYKGWSDIYEQIRDMIKTIHSEDGIDMDKIALTGHSLGGTGTYQLQVKLPNTFACIAPMSGSSEPPRLS